VVALLHEALLVVVMTEEAMSQLQVLQASDAQDQLLPAA
jgi:hypothetical protein